MSRSAVQWAALALVALTLAAPVLGGQRLQDAPCVRQTSESTLVSNLPRFDHTMKKVSGHWGDYNNWFNCTKDDTLNDDDYISVGDCRVINKASITEDNISSDEPLAPYLESLGFYMALPFLCIYFIISVVVLFIIFRYCCCCCCKKSQCCKCGGKYPTRRTMFLGYSYSKVPGHKTGAGVHKYSKKSKFCVAFFLVAFGLVIIGLMLAVDLKGNQGITDSSKAVAKTGTPFMNVLQSLVPEVEDYVVNLSNSTLRLTLMDLNRTIQETVSLSALESDLRCVAGAIRNLPDVQVMTNALDEFEADVDAVNASVQVVSSALRFTDGQLTALDGATTTMLTVVGDFDNQITALTTATSDLAAATVSVSDIQELFVAPNTGLVTVVYRNLSQLNDNYPTGAQIDETTGFVDDLLNGDMEGDNPTAATNRENMITSFSAVQGAFDRSFPNLNALAQLMTDYNTEADGTSTGALQDIFDDFDAAENALAAVYSSTFVNDTLNAVVDLANDLGLVAVNDSLLALNNVIYDFNIFDQVRLYRDQLIAVRNSLPCMDRLAQYILNVDRNLVQLPDDVIDLANQANNTRGELDPAIAELDTVIADMELLEQERDNITILVYTEEVTKAQQSVVDGLASLDISSVYANLALIDASRDVDFSIRSEVQVFNTTLATSRIDSALINDVDSLETTRQQLVTDMGTGLLYLQILDAGYCGHDNTTLCAQDSDCDNGYFCIALGEARCQFDQRISCTQDSDCGGGGSSDSCIVDPAFWNALRTLLDPGAKNGKPTGISDALTSLEAVNGTAYYDLSTLSSSLDGAIADFGSIDVSSIQTAGTDFQAAIGDVSVSEYLTEIDSLSQDLEVDLGDVRGALADFNSTAVDLNDDLETVDEAADGANSVMTLLDVLFPVYYETLSYANLNAVRTSAGMAGIVRELAGIPDNATAHLNATAPEYFDGDMVTTLVEDISEYDPLMDALSIYNPAYGALHYFATVYLAYTDVFDKEPLFDFTLVSPDDPTANTVFTDANGAVYTEQKDGFRHMCLSDACVDAWLDKINTEPISDLQDEEFPFENDSASVSREMAARVLYIFPAITLLLLLWSLLCFACCCKSKPSWQKVPVSCMTGNIICQLPCLFLISGMLFMIVLFLHDSCLGATSVGLQYLEARSDDACQWFGDSNIGDLESCAVAQSIITHDDPSRSSSVQFTVNIRDVYISMVSKCADADPLKPMWDGVADTVRQLPSNELEEVLDDLSGDSTEFQLRERLKNVFRQSATSLGIQTERFVDAIGDGTGSCSSLNPALTVVKERLCCETLDTLYWYITPWYIMAFVYCCCGCPCGILARKRLASGLWGKHYDLDKTDSVHVSTVEVVGSLSGMVDNNSAPPPFANANTNHPDAAYAPTDGSNPHGGSANPYDGSANPYGADGHLAGQAGGGHVADEDTGKTFTI